MITREVCAKWARDKTTNPVTGRKISAVGSVYEKLARAHSAHCNQRRTLKKRGVHVGGGTLTSMFAEVTADRSAAVKRILRINVVPTYIYGEGGSDERLKNKRVFVLALSMSNGGLCLMGQPVDEEIRDDNGSKDRIAYKIIDILRRDLSISVVGLTPQTIDQYVGVSSLASLPEFRGYELNVIVGVDGYKASLWRAQSAFSSVFDGVVNVPCTTFVDIVQKRKRVEEGWISMPPNIPVPLTSGLIDFDPLRRFMNSTSLIDVLAYDDPKNIWNVNGLIDSESKLVMQGGKAGKSGKSGMRS